MKNLLFTLFLAVISLGAQAQYDCTNSDRFNNRTYFNDVTVTSDVLFGSNFAVGSSNQEELYMDIYEPTGDTSSMRPLVLVAFGGSFVGGSRDAADVVAQCNAFAKMGYVAAAIDYRVGFFFPNEVTTTKAVFRATHDMRAAIRWFNKDRWNANTYKIDVDRVVAAGISAGAIASIHAAYFDKESEMPDYMANDTAGLGGVEGNSGNPGYSSKVAAVVNYSGAIGDSMWIESGDVPMISFHDIDDDVVPYWTEEVAVQGIPTGLIASGSGTMKRWTTSLGNVTHELVSYPRQSHVSYLGGAEFDITVDSVMSFLHKNLVCDQTLTTGIADLTDAQVPTVKTYPNPASNKVTISLEGVEARGGSVEIYNNAGQIQYLFGVTNETKITMPVTELTSGMYLVSIFNSKANLVGSGNFLVR